MKLLGALLAFLLALAPVAAQAQSTVLQAGPWTPGHAPMYTNSGGSQPIIVDSGTASGGGAGVGLKELGITVRGTGTPPYANAGTGPNGENLCDYDAPITNATGYHYLCMSPNAQGGGLVSYGNVGSAAQLPFAFQVNGNTYQFPFTVGGILGPSTSTVNGAACWNNTTGTLLKDCGAFVTVGGNNTWTGINNFTGPFQIGSVAQTFPPSGLIAGTSDTQALTNKTINAAANTITNVPNASLTNSSTTVNGQSCVLGSACTVTAVANSVTVGTTSITGGASGRVLYDSSGTLGELAQATSANYQANAASTLLNPNAVWSAAGTVALSDAATVAIDMSTGINFTLPLGLSTQALGAPTNTKVGQSGVIRTQQDATGGRTLTYNAVYKWAGGVACTISTGAGKIDYLFYWVFSSSEILLSCVLDVR